MAIPEGIARQGRLQTAQARLVALLAGGSIVILILLLLVLTSAPARNGQSTARPHACDSEPTYLEELGGAFFGVSDPGVLFFCGVAGPDFFFCGEGAAADFFFCGEGAAAFFFPPEGGEISSPEATEELGARARAARAEARAASCAGVAFFFLGGMVVVVVVVLFEVAGTKRAITSVGNKVNKASRADSQLKRARALIGRIPLRKTLAKTWKRNPTIEATRLKSAAPSDTTGNQHHKCYRRCIAMHPTAK
jgi:hypothetical protein